MRLSILERKENIILLHNILIYDHKQLKQELSDLLEQDAKADKLRCLPLYSCRITGWKFVCSKCYDKVYMYTIAKQRIVVIAKNITRPGSEEHL